MDRKIRWSTLASNQFEKTLRFWIDLNGNNRDSKFLFVETSKITKLLVKFSAIGRKTKNSSIRRLLLTKPMHYIILTTKM